MERKWMRGWWGERVVRRLRMWSDAGSLDVKGFVLSMVQDVSNEMTREETSNG